MSDKQNEIQQQIAEALVQITKIGPMLKGTVSKVKRGARKRGTGERTANLLTYKGKDNKTKSVYVPAQCVEEVQGMIARHRKAVRTIDRVVNLSVELFKEKRK